MGALIPIISVICVFSTPVIIVYLATHGPKARARAEIMRAEGLAKIEEKRNLLGAVQNEELSMTVDAQEKRIGLLEDEVAFLRKLAEKPR